MTRHNSADEYPDDVRNEMHVSDLQKREDAVTPIRDEFAGVFDKIVEVGLAEKRQRLQDLKDRQDAGDTSITGADIRRAADEVNKLDPGFHPGGDTTG